MYLATLRWAMATPSLSGSRWMRGAPQEESSVMGADDHRRARLKLDMLAPKLLRSSIEPHAKIRDEFTNLPVLGGLE